MHTLRSATAADHDFVEQLTLTASRDSVEQIWGWNDEIGALLRQDFERWFNPPEHGQIIQVDGRDVGYLKVEERDEGVLLDMIVLLPEYQGHGLGTALIEPVIAEAHARGEPAFLQVLKSNPSKRLYERLG